MLAAPPGRTRASSCRDNREPSATGDPSRSTPRPPRRRRRRSPGAGAPYTTWPEAEAPRRRPAPDTSPRARPGTCRRTGHDVAGEGSRTVRAPASDASSASAPASSAPPAGTTSPSRTSEGAPDHALDTWSIPTRKRSQSLRIQHDRRSRPCRMSKRPGGSRPRDRDGERGVGRQRRELLADYLGAERREQARDHRAIAGAKVAVARHRDADALEDHVLRPNLVRGHAAPFEAARPHARGAGDHGRGRRSGLARRPEDEGEDRLLRVPLDGVAQREDLARREVERL